MKNNELEHDKILLWTAQQLVKNDVSKMTGLFMCFICIFLLNYSWSGLLSPRINLNLKKLSSIIFLPKGTQNILIMITKTRTKLTLRLITKEKCLKKITDMPMFFILSLIKLLTTLAPFQTFFYKKNPIKKVWKKGIQYVRGKRLNVLFWFPKTIFLYEPKMKPRSEFSNLRENTT